MKFNKVAFTREQLEAAYNELDRRLEMNQEDGMYDRRQWFIEDRKAYLQGLYGTLMVLSADWPTVASWCRLIEEERGYWYYNENDEVIWK